MPIMESRISIHNKAVRNKQPLFQARTFNSINKANCPLNNACLSNNVLYKANKASMTEQRTMEINLPRHQLGQLQVTIWKSSKIF